MASRGNILNVSLEFRLYMMRYGIGLLASSFTNQSRPAFTEDIRRKVSACLTRECEIPEGSLSSFREYLINKPGSPRYTPLRRAWKRGQPPINVERQDLLLADPRLSSSVGALTTDYFDNALSLAHTLKLVRKNPNLLMARGRLSLSTGWAQGDPFRLNDKDSLYLGLWFLYVDSDWLWAFLSELSPDPDYNINAGNRVDLLLRSWKRLLSAREVRSHRPQNARLRTRLIELTKITERNVRQKLNLGQPWSWFLIPRLELLVDAGILRKKERHGLTGYSLTATGRQMRSVCDGHEGGDTLVHNYFSCRDARDRSVADDIEWDEIKRRLAEVAPQLRTSVGYYPITEAATGVCVNQFLDSECSSGHLWEIDSIKRRLWAESKSTPAKVRLAIDRRGQIYAFKI